MVDRAADRTADCSAGRAQLPNNTSEHMFSCGKQVDLHLAINDGVIERASDHLSSRLNERLSHRAVERFGEQSLW